MGAILSSVVAAIIAAALLWSFRVKQLYVVIPKMFRYGALPGTKGRVIELHVVNRGRGMEEDVHLDMPPAWHYELIASDQADVAISDNKLLLKRLPPRTTASFVVFYEGESQSDEFHVSITSKTTKGKQFKALEEVPGNIGNSVLIWLTIVVAAGAITWGPTQIQKWKLDRLQEESKRRVFSLGHITSRGWGGLEEYVRSSLISHYSGGEFPIHLNSSTVSAGVLTLQFDAANKLASPMTVLAKVKGAKPYAQVDEKRSTFAEIGPFEAKKISVSFRPDSELTRTEVDFMITAPTGQVISIPTHLFFYPGKNDDVIREWDRARSQSALKGR